MGLLDSVVGALGQAGGGGSGGGSNPQAALLQAILGMLAGGASGGGVQGGGLGGVLGGALGSAIGGAGAGGAGAAGGGLAGLIEQFTRGGLGDIASSWVGTGQNLPISPGQLSQVLGGARIDQMAGQLGMDSGDLLGQLSQMLPQVVDKLTPQGRIPEGDLGGLGNLGDLGSLLGSLSSR